MFRANKPLYSVLVLYVAIILLAIIDGAHGSAIRARRQTGTEICCCTDEFGDGHNRRCYIPVHVHDCASAVADVQFYGPCMVNGHVGYCANMFGAIACLDHGNPEPIDNPAKYAGQHKDVTFRP